MYNSYTQSGKPAFRAPLVAALCAGFLFLSACSDDSSSSAGDEPAVSTKTSALEVDEEHNIITWTTENSKDMCLLENGSFTWKTVNLGTSKESARYEFRGDTLVLYPLVYKNGKQERFGRMYLGGTAGKIYRTWRALFCDFDPVEKNTFCATGDVFTTKTITLSKGKMITETLYDFERYSAQKSGNLVLSELTADILRALKGTFELYIPGAFVDDSARVQSLIQEYKITTVSQTKKSINFKMDDKEYALKYNEAEETLAKDGSELRKLSCLVPARPSRSFGPPSTRIRPRIRTSSTQVRCRRRAILR